MDKKKVVIAGGTGLIGRRLTEMLLERGCEVCWLSRRQTDEPGVKIYSWDVRKGYMEDEALEGCYAVINLAGAGIADKRWTDSRKKAIEASRIESTRLLCSKMASMPEPPSVFVGASAIGYYGDRGHDWVDENSDPGNSGFLPQSVQQIEKAINESVPEGVRKVIPRFGVVLSTKGGALVQFFLPLRLGVSPSLGGGDQIMSWVHIDDVCRFLVRGIEDQSIRGVFNITSPNPVSYHEFAKLLRKHWNSFTIVFPVPAFILRIALGEMADTVLESTRVRPRRLMEQGFEFHHPELAHALADLKSRRI